MEKLQAGDAFTYDILVSGEPPGGARRAALAPPSESAVAATQG